MATTSQIVPEHEYAHVMTVIHDNSARPSDSLSSAETTYCNMMFVFSSPKGIDRELRTVDGGFSDFVERYGIGTFDAYGQPFLNAYAAASTNAATLHCLRVTADDATYSAGALVAHYKVTPGIDTSAEATITSSDKVDLMGHENVYATDEVEETTGDVSITIAGTDVEPGISEENAELFGNVSGEYIDVTIDLSKIVNLEDTTIYQVTQVNNALSLYDGADEYISQVDGIWTKVKTYTGAALKEGYSMLLGAQSTATLSIVEWGAIDDGYTVTVVNDTDLGVKVADAKASYSVKQDTDGYTLSLTGEIVAGVLNADLWGAVNGNNEEVDLVFPNLDSDKMYKVIQTNDNLSLYDGDPTISQVGDSWKKVKEYQGADITDGYAILVGEGKGATVSLYEADGFMSEADSTPITTIVVDNGATFVASHEQEITTGAIGDPVNVIVNTAVSFTTTTTRSSILRAKAAARSVTNAITEEAEEATPGSMDIYYTFEGSEEDITDTTNLGSLIPVDSTPDENGYTAVKIFEIACRGRGSWGNNVRFTLDSYARGDRLSSFKNYTLSVYEISNATLTKKEEYTVAFSSDAVNTEGDTLFADYIVSDPYENSSYIAISTNTNAFEQMYAAYVTVVPDTAISKDKFDPLLGRSFGTTTGVIDNLTIDMTSAGTIAMNGASGIALLNGSDGSFAEDSLNRDSAMQDAYLKAYSGEIDRNVRSKKLYPTDIILDANFSLETKIAIHELVTEREDCVAIYDLGTQFNTYAALMAELADLEVYANSRNEAIEGYYGRIQDPVSYKIVTVSSTYALARMYPLHFQEQGDKHVPLAGSSYGVMSGFLSGTAYPVYDDDLDSDIMDSLTESKVNYLKVNNRKQVVRGAQTTRQLADTNLSELNNVFILLDIRRDAIQLCELYEYNFAEDSDMQRFNKAASLLAAKYQDAQVKSISAVFDMNDWESERGILHLYIDFIHKNIIKRSIVEISVNRGTVDT
jgi:hypothetical protein